MHMRFMILYIIFESFNKKLDVKNVDHVYET